MTDHLVAEPHTDPDAVFRNFQRHNLARACEHFDLTVTGSPSFGWRLRSIGAPTTGPDGACWLRVVSEEPQWAQGHGWTGNLDANSITGVSKPRVLDVLDVFEWPEGDWRNQRAEVMTLVPGSTCSPVDVLNADPDLSAAWWTNLHETLDTVAAIPAERTHADQHRVTQRITDRFGPAVDTTVAEWTTAHGDLHWSNVMAPRLAILDWELWGRGPAGTDAATLYCYALLAPRTASTVRALFADVLDTPTGRVAQLYVIARLLRRVDGGDYPELAEPLQALASSLVGHS